MRFAEIFTAYTFEIKQKYFLIVFKKFFLTYLHIVQTTIDNNNDAIFSYQLCCCILMQFSFKKRQEILSKVALLPLVL